MFSVVLDILVFLLPLCWLVFSYGTILRKLHKDISDSGGEVGGGEKGGAGREGRGVFGSKRWGLSKLAFWRGSGDGKRSESTHMTTCVPTSTRASMTTSTKANLSASNARAKKNQNFQNKSERLTICVNSVENSGGDDANGDNGSDGSDSCDGDAENSGFAVHSLSLCKMRERNLQHDNAKADTSASQKVPIYLYHRSKTKSD